MSLGERTHYAGTIGTDDLGQEVLLKGWVRRRRDLGSLVFVDLRDREGIVQLVFSEDRHPEVFGAAKDLRPEFVIAVKGVVENRTAKDVNPHMATGAVEVEVSALEVLAKAETPPFAVEDDALVSEDLRLQYRYLDLRRPFQNARIVARHRLAQRTRNFLSGEGFIEIETPFLTKSTPEGARDFLVPVAPPAGCVLRLAPIAPALQAALHGGGLRPVLPGGPVLPRRGPAGRSAAGVYPDRHRDVLSHRGPHHVPRRAPRPRTLRRGGRDGAGGCDATDLRPGHGPIRVRQARHPFWVGTEDRFRDRRGHILWCVQERHRSGRRGAWPVRSRPGGDLPEGAGRPERSGQALRWQGRRVPHAQGRRPGRCGAEARRRRARAGRSWTP